MIRSQEDDGHSNIMVHLENSSPPVQHHVEIATLSVPAVATESGIVSGEGTNFILEAPTHVIDDLECCKEQQNHQHQPCIEGVIDIDAVSNLVSGITEEEFVGLLHHEASLPQQSDQNIATEQVVALEGGILLDSSKVVATIDEHRPLLRTPSDSITSSKKANACITLSADPFIQTLAVHHQDSQGDEDVTIIETIDTTVTVTDDDNRDGEHTHDAKISREAFLLSIPATNDGIGGNNFRAGDTGIGDPEMEGTFILALPEMTDQPTKGEIEGDKHLEIETPQHHEAETFVEKVVEAVTEIVDEVEQIIETNDMPTDVQNVNLQVEISTVPSGKDEAGVPEVHLNVVVDREV